MKKGLCLVLSALTLISGGMTSALSVSAANGTSNNAAVCTGRIANVKPSDFAKEIVVGKTYAETYNNTYIKGNIVVGNTSIISAVAKKVGNSKGKNKIIIKGLKEGIASVKFKTADGVAHTIKVAVSKYKYSDVFQNTVKVGSMTYQSDCTLKNFDVKQVYKVGRRIKYVKSISGSGKVFWKTGSWGNDSSIGYVIFSVKSAGSETVQVKYTDGYADNIRFTTKKEPTPAMFTYSKDSVVTYDRLVLSGRIYWNDLQWTYYSQSIMPNTKLNIPGRHVDGGFVCDKNGYIVLALPVSGIYRKYQVINTPFGKKGKFYDYNDGNSIDVYTK